MEFQVLGPLEVRKEGKAVALGGPQPQRLVAALLTHANTAVSADRLAQELLGEDASGAAVATVQSYVSRLRKVLGDRSRIETTRRPVGYRLRVEPGELDAERFALGLEQAKRAMSAGAPERARPLLHSALGMWRGEPFDGLELGPAARPEAERMAENRRAARDARVALDLDAGLHDSLVGELHHELRVDPTDEAVGVQLMVALYRCGRQREALEVFTQVCEELAELGLTPGPPLQDMQRRILEHDPELAFAPPSPARDAPTPLPPVLAVVPRVTIVGREAEQERLREVVAQVSAGARRVVLMEGEPGVGKTRLAADAALAAHEAKFAVGWGASAEGLSASYGVWHDALSHLVTHMPDRRVAEHVAAYGNAISHLIPSFDRQLIPSLERQFASRAAVMGPAPGTERELLFAAVARLLRTLCADQRVALVLDDLHWANPQSLRLLRYVAGDTPDLPLLVIATCRDRGMPEGYPVRALHADLRRLPDAEPPDGGKESDRAVVSMELGRLDRTQVRELIAAVAGHDIGPGGEALADALSDETAGIPFFVREVLRHLRDCGAVEEDHEGRWRLVRTITELDLPQSVHDVVAQRVGQLGVETRSIVSAASVIGRSFDARLLARVVGLDEDRVEDALAAASRSHILAELRTPLKHYGFAHACFEHSLYAQFPPRERGRRHIAVARALEDCDRGDPVERAHHWVTAGDPDCADQAVRYARRAGERALEQLAPDDAVRWFEAARDVLENDDAQVCDILTRLGVAQRQVGGEFGETLTEAAKMAERIGDHRRLARAVVANTAGPFGAAGRADESRMEWLNRALAALPEEAPEVPLIGAVLGKELYFGGEPAAGAEKCRRALEQARARYQRFLAPSDGSPRDPAEVPAYAKRELANVLAYATAISPFTPPEQHAALAAELADLAEQLDDRELRFEVASARFIRGMYVGNPDELDEGLRTMEDVARSGVPILLWTALWSASARRLVEGDLREAERLADEAAELGRSRGVDNWDVVAFGQHVGIAAERGTLEELTEEAERLARMHPYLPLLQLARTFIAAEMGQHEKAAGGFAETIQNGYHFDYPQTRAACLARCAEIALRLGERSQYSGLYELLQPYGNQFATPAGITSRGSIHLTLARLASALGEDRDGEEHFHAAEAAHDRLRARLMQARTDLARGEALLLRQPDRAVELLSRAHDRAAYHDGMATVNDAQTLLERATQQCGQPSSALLS